MRLRVGLHADKKIMSNWYILSVIALILMGTQRFLYKVSAERKCNTAWTTFSFMATVTILSSIVFVVLKESVTNVRMLILTAFLNSGSFLIGTITHIEALKHIPSSVVYPIIRLNMVVVVLFSVFFFKDKISVYQVIGICIAIGVIIILTREVNEEKRPSRNIKRGLMLVGIALLSGSVASISSKFAAVYVNKIAFMTFSYFLGTCFSLGLVRRLETQETSKNHKEAFMIGFVMGVINFFGFYTFLKALSGGPLSIIVSMIGMHFVIAIILSALIYKDRLTRLRILGISLTVLSIFFLRLGPA